MDARMVFPRMRGKYNICVLVAGGREFDDRQLVNLVLDSINRKYTIRRIVHGSANGADTLAKEWADMQGVQEKGYPAIWAVHGKQAGAIRNRQMMQEHPDLVVAFPGNAGTKDMVEVAETNKVPVHLPCGKRSVVGKPSKLIGREVI